MKTNDELFEEGSLLVRDYDGHEQMLMNKGTFIAIMEEYASKFRSEWISVSDRLPRGGRNDSIPCLCWDNYHKQIRVLQYNEYHKCWDDESGDDYYTDAVGGKVTHWMPLPSAPEKGGEE